MKEKILDATLQKVFELSSEDFICPTSSNLDSLSKEEVCSFYEKSWNLVCTIHDLAFKARQSVSLLETLDL